jgi:hypothetical protein
VTSPLLPLYRFLLDLDTRSVFCCYSGWGFEVEAKAGTRNNVYFTTLCHHNLHLSPPALPAA